MTEALKPAFAEDFERLYKEREAALIQVEELTRQKNEHADNARDRAAEVDQLRRSLEEEESAHLGTRSKVGGLQERVGVIPELERKYAEVVAERNQALGEAERLKQTLAKAARELEATKDALSVSEQARRTAVDKLSAYERLAEALRTHSDAREVIAAEAARLNG